MSINRWRERLKPARKSSALLLGTETSTCCQDIHTKIHPYKHPTIQTAAAPTDVFPTRCTRDNAGATEPRRVSGQSGVRLETLTFLVLSLVNIGSSTTLCI